MSTRDLFREAVRALSANRGRSFLTILGIVIGIAAVIAMTALIGGIRNTLVGSMGLNAARIVTVSASTPITDREAEKLARAVPGYESIEGTRDGYTQIEVDKRSVSVGITGFSAAYPEMTGMSAKLAEGRFFTEAEADTARRVAVISRAGIDALFGVGSEKGVGQRMTLNGKSYEIIGILEDGVGGGADTSYFNAYMPAKTVEEDFSSGTDGSLQLTALAREGEDIDALMEQTKTELARIKGIPDDEAADNVWTYSMKSSIDALNTFMASFQLMIGAVAGISLLVGGIGIMNMMLTNVTERIREIGVRRALGARRRDITLQFLTESSMLCVVGGAIGTLAGYAIAWGLSFGASALGFDIGAMAGMGGEQASVIVPAVEPGAIAFAVGVSVAIGIVFGFYPARRAAKMDPVECLRYQ